MKRRQPGPVSIDPGGIPLPILAGRCIEVWGGTGDRADYIARRAWSDARDRYLRKIGLSRADYAQWPEPLKDHAVWSYDFYAKHRPADLADKLADRGLPPDWTPEPEPPGSPA